jgi:hypothetical protein
MKAVVTAIATHALKAIVVVINWQVLRVMMVFA